LIYLNSIQWLKTDCVHASIGIVIHEYYIKKN